MTEKQARIEEKNPPRVTVRLPRWLHAAYKRIAVAEGRSENAVYLEALTAYAQAKGYEPG